LLVRPRQPNVSEKLMHIKIIAVSRAWPAVAVAFQPAFELGKEPEILARVRIGMQH
jgi:hypothetical protein